MNPFAPKYHAFTQKYPGRSLRIITPVRIAEPFDPNNVPSNPKYIDTQALWDTGATHSVITEASAKALVLVATGKRMVHHAGGEGEYNTHVVNFVLPNQVGVAGILVSECPDVGGQFGAIIGMDIISQVTWQSQAIRVKHGSPLDIRRWLVSITSLTIRNSLERQDETNPALVVQVRSSRNVMARTCDPPPCA